MINRKIFIYLLYRLFVSIVLLCFAATLCYVYCSAVVLCNYVLYSMYCIAYVVVFWCLMMNDDWLISIWSLFFVHLLISLFFISDTKHKNTTTTTTINDPSSNTVFNQSYSIGDANTVFDLSYRTSKSKYLLRNQ